MQNPKYYKVIVTTTYYNEVIVKANSKEEVEGVEEKIINRINPLDDAPEVEVTIDERPDYDDDDVVYDLTKFPIDRSPSIMV